MKLFNKGSLVRNAAWVFLGQGLSVICQGLYFILLARLLGSVEYGIYVGTFATVAILSVYSPLGSQFTLLRYVSASINEFPLYWGNVLVTTISLGSIFVGILVCIVPRLAHFYSGQLVFCVAVGDCLCGQITDASSRVFQAFEEMRITALLGILTNLLRTILVGFLLWHLGHATAQQWVIATLAISVLASVSAVSLVTWRYGRPAFSARLLRERAGEGFVFALSSSTTGIYNNFDKAMLGHFGMNAANGIYAMAYRVVDICTMPISSIHGAAFPRFFRKGAGGISSTALYAVRIIKKTSLLALLLAVAMVVTAPAIPLLLGNSFRESVVALRWLCLLPLFRSFQYSAGDALAGAGYQHLRLCAQVMAAVFNFGVNIYLIPHYGWLGAAWSSLITDGMLGAINWGILFVTMKKGVASTK